MKNIIKFTFLSITSWGFLVSCDGSDSSTDSNTTTTSGTTVVQPPSNPATTPASNNNPGNDTSAAVASNEVSFANQVFVKINGARNSNGGLAPLVRDSNLDALAAAHNVYMRSNAVLNANPIQINHDNFQSRANQAFSLGYTSFGENVAGVRDFPAAQVTDTFVNGWINSPGHFKNIVGDFTRTGIAVLVDTRDGTIYATQLFAK